MNKTLALTIVIVLSSTACAPTGDTPIQVNRTNYQEAETARNFNNWVAKGANNKLIHMTDLTPSGPAPTVRMNRDTLYSVALLDTSSGTATITLPEGDLYQSVMMVDTDDTLLNVFLIDGGQIWEVIQASSDGSEATLEVVGNEI